MTFRLQGSDPWLPLDLTVQLNGDRREYNVHVDIFDAHIVYQNGEVRDCKAIAINKTENRELFEIELVRLRGSYALNPRHCILGHTCFYDACSPISYFCYDQYDHNLKSFMKSGCNAVELKRVIRDFIKTLTQLHGSGTYHGHIKYFNLVIRDGRGFLAGGVGPRVSRCYVIKKRRQIDIVDPREHDIVSFAQAIEECCPKSSRDPELDALVQFLKFRKSMHTLTYHPYVLKPMKRREFFMRVRDAFSELGKSGDSYLGLLNAKHTMGIKGQVKKSWVKRMEQMRNTMIQHVLHDGPNKYGKTLTEFVRFCRNFYVHAERDPGVSWITHFNTLHSSLNQAIPEYAIFVHNVCYQESKLGGKVFK